MPWSLAVDAGVLDACAAPTPAQRCQLSFRRRGGSAGAVIPGVRQSSPACSGDSGSTSVGEATGATVSVWNPNEPSQASLLLGSRAEGAGMAAAPEEPECVPFRGSLSAGHATTAVTTIGLRPGAASPEFPVDLNRGRGRGA
jgi:hypothetical protein